MNFARCKPSQRRGLPLKTTEIGKDTLTMSKVEGIFLKNGRKEPRILIAGLGDLLLRDDGVGIQAVRELQKDPPAGAKIIEVGTGFVDNLHLLEWAERILAIDAMHAGGAAGTLYSIQVSDVEDRSPQASRHVSNLWGALRFLPNGKRPLLLILGVEPAIIDYGLNLSTKVQNTLPVLIQSVREIVDYWHSTHRSLNSR
jgi:hydrogenase maturation protease